MPREDLEDDLSENTDGQIAALEEALAEVSDKLDRTHAALIELIKRQPSDFPGDTKERILSKL